MQLPASVADWQKSILKKIILSALPVAGKSIRRGMRPGQRQTILSSVRHHRYTSYHFIPRNSHSKMGGMDILIICAGTGELNPELSYQLEEPTLLTNVIGFTNIADWGFRYFEQQKKRASGYYFLCWRYTRQWHRSRLQCVESLSNQLYGRITTKSN